MQLLAGRTGLGSAPGPGRAHCRSLVSLLLIHCLINIAAALKSPQILLPANDTVISKEGDSLRIECRAQTRWPRLHNVYWLVNNMFVEDVYPDGRVTEQSGGALAVNRTVEQTLEFTTVQSEDFGNTFTCVVQDPSGTDVKHFNLNPENDGGRIIYRLTVKKAEKEPDRR
ncbi:interleukin-1 receptor type 2-like isoform X1 [Bufo gargarizans]|uniref:interleukin-1 receptor type 2-like isoform X1 n=1 Tax=Bufo gargarizans TaxID=30331 RepID=UPI001CF3B238|nr:interleukin-1 receptor type 2-like isoform X1 [Bufo gargarizans]